MISSLKLLEVTLKEMIKDFTASYAFIPFFVLSVLGITGYYYCFVAEHEIFSGKQKALSESTEFTMTATCRPVDIFTSAPYVTVKLGNFEVVSTAVNSGYDFTSDCINSSVKDIQLAEDGRNVKIYMKSGQVKEIPIIYYSK